MDFNAQINNTDPDQRGNRSGNRILFKALLMGAMILLLLIPAAFIGQLVQERAGRQQEVVKEVSSKWAQMQTIKGPVLMIPYLSTEVQQNRPVSVRHYAFFTPEHLTVNGNIDPEIRHRSIYEVMLYRSQLKLEGNFLPVDPALLGLTSENMIWNEAILMTGINDLHGLEEEVQLQWDGVNTVMEPGLPAQQLFSSGLNKRCAILPGKAYPFSISLKLKGSQALLFSPIAKTTHVAVRSSWQHPSFEGQFLPDTSKTVAAKGFSAVWDIPQTSSGIPSAFRDLQQLDTASFGVRLLQPADGYAKTERSVKYALLFIALTFTLFFFSELFGKNRCTHCNISWSVWLCAFSIPYYCPLLSTAVSILLT